MNEEAVISRTIKQFLKSTAGLSQVEMVIIDDDSSDKTSSITKMVIAQEKNDRVKLFERKKPNAQIGKGEALNWAYSRLISQNNPTNLVCCANRLWSVLQNVVLDKENRVLLHNCCISAHSKASRTHKGTLGAGDGYP